jgi:hypothetical protein
MRYATLLAPLTLGEGLTLTETTFIGTTGLDQLRLRGEPRWYSYRRRASLADEVAARGLPRPQRASSSSDCQQVAALRDDPEADGSTDAPHSKDGPEAAGSSKKGRLGPELAREESGRPSYAQVETLYRQLRAALEEGKAAPDAADFYYGEMEMRRLRARSERRLLEASLLRVYKTIGGYGVRAWRPLAAYLLVIAATAIALLVKASRRHLVTADIVNSLHLARVGGAFGFVFRNSTSIFQAPADQLTGLGTSVFVLERFAAVSLLALFVLAVRSKVQR